MAAARRIALLLLLLAVLVLMLNARELAAFFSSSRSAVVAAVETQAAATDHLVQARAARRAVQRFHWYRSLFLNRTRTHKSAYGPLCRQGPRDPCFANTSCTLQPMPPRWHVSTQEGLIKHLRALWPERNARRTMLDLGCQAGHGPYRNVSDTLLWLDAFHARGSLVVGVDAYRDYALDLQHRLDHVAPYSLMAGVEKRAIHAAVGTPWNCDAQRQVTTTSSARGGHGGGGGTASAASSIDASCEFNLDLDGAFTHLYCSRNDWRDHFAVVERHGITDHSCRITRPLLTPLTVSPL